MPAWYGVMMFPTGLLSTRPTSPTTRSPRLANGYQLNPAQYSCESRNSPNTNDVRAYSSSFGWKKFPTDASKPWSKVELIGNGPSARKLLSQRKKYWPLMERPSYLRPASMAHMV